MKLYPVTLTATLALVSAQVDAALVTQSLQSSIGVTTSANNLVTNTTASDENYTYTSFTGFDSSLGDLVSVTLDITGELLQNRWAYSYLGGVSVDYYTEYALNANVGAGNYNQNLFHYSDSTTSTCVYSPGSFGCNTSTSDVIIDGTQTPFTINLLNYYQLSDFLIQNIGFQDHRFTSLQQLSCTSGGLSVGCNLSNVLANNLTLTLNYTYDDGLAAVPVPAAVWLFGSGLLGLIGVAKRKKVA